ncbi:hypothetical protein GCM10023333_30710 [Ferrimonas pelagia]|uniref:Uncharacterized protein n=1 Tax=Ferrimonas pelagia TaxID=1177826 RepID=A0ABP9F8F3_9GAMM
MAGIAAYLHLVMAAELPVLDDQGGDVGVAIHALLIGECGQCQQEQGKQEAFHRSFLVQRGADKEV